MKFTVIMKNEPTYPYVAKFNASGSNTKLIVLFVAPKQGLVLESNDPEQPVGAFLSAFSESGFIPHSGSTTIIIG